MKGLEVGGLALVIKSNAPEKVGRCVKVVEILIDDRFEYLRGGILHLGDADGSLCAFVEFDPEGEWLYPATHLIPLQGDPDAVVVDQKELAMS